MKVPEHVRQRLESLGGFAPEWHTWLVLLETTISSVNDPAWDLIETRLDPERPAAAPVLAGAEIALDPSLGRRWVRRLLATAARERGAAAGSLGTAPSKLDPLPFLQAVVCQDTATLGDLGAKVGADPKALGALVGLAAMPLLQACARRLRNQVPGTWSRGYCPVCGAWPAFGEVRGLERTLRLRCARCGDDWRSEWRCCVYCGQSDHERLGSLVSEADGETRKIDTCAECRGYLKTLTALRPSPADAVALEDLGTADLDVAAFERGYSRPARPGYILGARIVEVAGTPRWRRVFQRRS